MTRLWSPQCILAEYTPAALVASRFWKPYGLNVRHRLTRSLQSAGEQSDKERRLIAGA